MAQENSRDIELAEQQQQMRQAEAQKAKEEAERALEAAREAEKLAVEARERAELAAAKAAVQTGGREGEVTASGHDPVGLDVHINTAFVYDVLLYHMYSTFGGFCINIAGLTAMILGGIRYYLGMHSLMAAFGFIIMGIFIVAFTPLNLKLRAKNTADLPKYQGTIHYVFSDYGIDEQMVNGDVNHYDWARVSKAVNTPKTISYYLDNGNEVLIFPKEDFDNKTFRDAMWHLNHNVVMGKIYIH